MLTNIISRFPYCFIGSTGFILISRNILNQKINRSDKFIIIIMFIYTLINIVVFDATYDLMQTFINFLSLFLCVKILFDKNITTSFFVTIITFIIVLLSEIILSLNLTLIENSIIIRDDMLLFSLTNFCVMLIGYVISKLKFIRKLTNNFIKHIDNNNYITEIYIVLFILISMIFIYYQLFITRYISSNIVYLIVFNIILFVLLVVYMYDKMKYNDLYEKYNTLFDYACSFEEEIEKDSLARHESKNQLSVIRDMTKNKKVISYIDGILKTYKDEKKNEIKGINNLPKGGFRGLIYYKLCVAKSKNINFTLDVSRNLYLDLSKIKEDDVKILSYAIGVCLDNAIEECSKDINSNFCLEIYEIDNYINFVISNTLTQKIDLDKIGKYLYSTKGKNHGRGLYLVTKEIESHKNISIESKVVKDYFVQKLRYYK